MSGFRHVSIMGSVGRGGVNRAADVVAIQDLINAHRPPGLRPLRVDGLCGPRTIAAIAQVERHFAGLSRPDGRISPNGLTLRALNHLTSAHPRRAGLVVASAAPRPAAVPRPAPAHQVAPPVAPRPGARAATASDHAPPDEIVRAAQAAQVRWHVPASVSIAQWMLESGSGHHMPAGSNNPFGIKAAAGQPSVTATTREETTTGRSIHIRARFRKFDTLAQAFDEHGRLLATHPAYAVARQHPDDPDAFADALTHRYATDSQYGTLLKSIMRGRDLYRFNQ